MAREVISAGGLIIEGSRILLVEHADGSLGFAKGHVEDGETLFYAARREFGEETCRKARIIGFIGSVSRKSIDYETGSPELVDKTVVIFLMADEGPTGLPYEAHTTPAWVEGREAASRMRHPEEAVLIQNRVLPLIDVAAYEDYIANNNQDQAGNQ